MAQLWYADVTNARKSFKSYDVKDSNMFRKSENLAFISKANTWTVYCAQHFKSEILERSEFGDLEKYLSKVLRGLYSVTLSSLKGPPFSPASLKVQVLQRKKVFYEAVFISISDISDRDFVSPLLLVSKSSHKKIVPKFHSILQRLLEFTLRPVHLTEAQCYWSIGILNRMKPYLSSLNQQFPIDGILLHETLRRRNTSSDFHLTSSLPLEGVSATVQLSLSKESLGAIWNSIPHSSENKLSLETVTTFLNGVFQHFSTVYRMELKTSPIASISLENVSARLEKQMMIRLNKPEIAFSILSYLETEFAES